MNAVLEPVGGAAAWPLAGARADERAAGYQVSRQPITGRIGSFGRSVSRSIPMLEQRTASFSDQARDLARQLLRRLLVVPAALLLLLKPFRSLYRLYPAPCAIS
jgi:hypothetical protein